MRGGEIPLNNTPDVIFNYFLFIQCIIKQFIVE
jgi:hypothetical protein